MASKPTLEEAKKNFAESMEALSLREIVRAHPAASVAISAAAGAAAGRSGRRAARLLLPILELAGTASRILSK